MSIKGTDHLLLIIGAETLILLFQLFNYLSRRRDRSRLLFLYFLSSIILFNTVNYCFLNWLDLSFLVAKIISYVSCSVLALFHVIYIINEFGFQEEVSTWSKVGAGVGSCLLTAYIASHFLFGASEIARAALVVLPLIATVLLCVYFNVRIKEKRRVMKEQGEAYQILLYSSFFTFSLITAIPTLVYFDLGNFNVFFLNIAFAGVIIGYYHRFLLKNIDESERLDDTKLDLNDFHLTKREREIGELLLQGYSYEEIAEDIIHRAEGTVTKHSSNLFEKVNCVDKNDFIRKFRTQKRT